MANERDDRRWVVDPPVQAGEIALHIVGGEGASLTEEQEAALGALLEILEAGDPEVVGHTKNCPKLNACSPLSCTKVTCSLSCGELKALTTSTATDWTLMGSFGRGL